MINHRTTELLVGLLWLALWSGAARGQSPELQEAYDSFEVLYAKDYYEEALPFAKEALRLGKQEFGLDHPITATLLNSLAALYEAQGAYAEAEPLYRRAMAIYETALGPEQPNMAMNLENYAALLLETGRTNEAKELETRARAIWAKQDEWNPAGR